MKNKKIFILYFLIVFTLPGIFPIFSVYAQGTCKPAYVVLVIDRSGSMSGDRIAAAKEAAQWFTHYLIPDTTSINREALVSFSSSATTDKGWTNDGGTTVTDGTIGCTATAGTMCKAIEGLSAGGGTRYVPPLTQAQTLLTPPPTPPAVSEVIIFLSDGLPEDGTAAKTKAATIKEGLDGISGTDDDVIIYTIGLGVASGSAAETLLKDIATSPAHYYSAPSPSDLETIYKAIFLALNDKDKDGFLDAACPGGDDWDDGEPCINPSSTEAMMPANPGECNSTNTVSALFGIREDYICSFKYYGYDCYGTQKGVCVVNCTDDFDNDQDGYTDVFDENCPLTGGIVPCGRMRDDPATPEFENCPCRLCHFLILGDKVVDFALFRIVLPLAVLLMIIGGVMFLTAGGSPAKIFKAKNLLRNVIIGTLIIFAAWIIVNTILMLIGVADWTGLKEGWWRIECPVPSICCKYAGITRIPCFKSVDEPCKLPWEP